MATNSVNVVVDGGEDDETIVRVSQRVLFIY